MIIAANIAVACVSYGSTQSSNVEVTPASRYLFYLHGAIIEQQGPHAVSDRYGAYEYFAILDKFRNRGFEVISETRPPDTDVWKYAETVVNQVKALLDDGVQASRITVVGASKGAAIASIVSTKLEESDVRYVLIGNCNQWLLEMIDPRLTGDVLSIYESSDEIGQSCDNIVARSGTVTEYKEIRLETGDGHGFLYKPMKEWIEPTVAWARR